MSRVDYLEGLINEALKKYKKLEIHVKDEAVAFIVYYPTEDSVCMSVKGGSLLIDKFSNSFSRCKFVADEVLYIEGDNVNLYERDKYEEN